MNLFVAGEQESKRLTKRRYLNLDNLKHQSVQWMTNGIWRSKSNKLRLKSGPPKNHWGYKTTTGWWPIIPKPNQVLGRWVRQIEWASHNNRLLTTSPAQISKFITFFRDPPPHPIKYTNSTMSLLCGEVTSMFSFSKYFSISYLFLFIRYLMPIP